jgi:hypothetical protein
MEMTLTRRFANVARKFGRGLLQVTKGSILGVSVALLAKLLNPLKEVEERIKSLLEQGTDARDLAEKFNTSTGNIGRLQAVGKSLGLTPEKLNEMMSRYADAIETAREELADPNKDKSDQTKVLRQFVDEKDLAEGFFKFLQSLKAQGQAQGMEARQKTEKTIFGERQIGGARRLIDADYPTQFQNASIPGADRLDKALNKLASLQDLDNQRAGGRGARDVISGAAGMNRKMIEDMAKAEELRIERENKNLAAFDDLKKASNGIQEIMNGLNEVMKLLTKGIGMFGELLKKISESRLFKFGSMFGGK